MAQIVIKSILDNTQFNSGIEYIKKTISSLEKNPITIKVKIDDSAVNNTQKVTQATKTLTTQIQATTGAYGDNAEQTKKAADAQQKYSKEAKEGAKSTNLLGDSLVNVAAKMAVWQIMGQLIAVPIRAFKEALDTLKAVDDQLVVIRKVTDASESSLQQIEEQAYKTASAYGVAADAYLESVAEFARAGYNEQSEALAELAVKTQLVGDVDAETANQFLLSVDAAYQYKGSIEELTKVLDGANEIDNKYATSIQKIAEGLGTVAPIAAQGNVGIDELSAAIGTITAVTQRSGTEAARAFRALILNIVGDTKTEIEDGVTWTAGEIEGLRDVIRQYAPEAYAAAEATGSLINPMEAIAGLAQAMEEGLLTEQKLMDMVSDIGGKLRTSQLLALIQNWDMYQSMLADFGTAVGSADKEVENALDSWTAKTNILKNTWTELVSNLIDTDFIKDALDVLIKAVELLNSSFGQAIIKITAFTAAALLLVKAFKALSNSAVGSIVKDIGAFISLASEAKTVEEFSMTVKELGSSLKAIAEANPVMVISAIIAGIKLLGDLIDPLITTTEELQEQIQNTYDEIDALEAERDQLLALEKLTDLEEQRLSLLNAQLEVKQQIAKEDAQELSERLFGEGSAYSATEGFYSPTELYWQEQAGIDNSGLATLERLVKEYGQLKGEIDSFNSLEYEDVKDAEEAYAGLNEELSEITTKLAEYGDNLLFIKESGLELEPELERLLSQITGLFSENELDRFVSEKLAAGWDWRSIVEDPAYKELEKVESTFATIAEGTEQVAEGISAIGQALSEIEDDAQPLKDVLEILEAGDLTLLNEENLSELLDAFPDLTDELKNYVDAIESGADPTETLDELISELQKELDTFNTEQLKSGIEDIVSAAEEWGAASEQVNSALENLGAQFPSLKAALYDVETGTWRLSDAALQSSSSFLAEAQAIIKADLAAKQSDYSQLIAHIQDLGKAALDTASYMLLMAATQQAALMEQEITDMESMLNSLSNISISVSASGGGGSGGGGGSSATQTDEILEAHKARVELLESELKLLEDQGAPIENQVAKMREIQSALHEQAEYLRSIGAEQTEINALSSEWWSIQRDIVGLQEDLKDELADALSRELEIAEKAKDEEIAAIDAEIDRLKESRNLEEEKLTLKEKQKAVTEAEIALINAQNERTIRMYNAASGQWEWVADAQAVKDAQDALEEAKEDLADYESELAYEAEIAALEARKEAIELAYETLEAEMDGIVEAMEEPARAISEILRDIAVNGTPQMKAQIENVNALLGNLNNYISAAIGKTTGASYVGGGGTAGHDYSTDTTDYSALMDNASTYDEFVYWAKQRELKAQAQGIDITGSGWRTEEEIYQQWLEKNTYDKGGLLKGIGGIKATTREEAVLDPELTERMLSPVADNVFRQRIAELGYLFGTSNIIPQSVLGSFNNRTSTVTNNGGPYYFNGIEIGAQTAETMTIADLARQSKMLSLYNRRS